MIDAILALLEAPFIVTVLIVATGACCWDTYLTRKYGGHSS